MITEQVVYLIEQPESGHTKIGISDDPYRRLCDLQHGTPLALNLRYIMRHVSSPASAIEAQLHLKFAADRGYGEWFHLTADAIVERLQKETRRKSGLRLRIREIEDGGCTVNMRRPFIPFRWEDEIDSSDDDKPSKPLRWIPAIFAWIAVAYWAFMTCQLFYAMYARSIHLDFLTAIAGCAFYLCFGGVGFMTWYVEGEFTEMFRHWERYGSPRCIEVAQRNGHRAEGAAHE
jgi:hypothetical protein